MAGPTNQQEKMAVFSSVDQKNETLSKGDASWEDANQGYGRALTKNRSFESQSKKKSSFQITRVIDRGAFHVEDGDVDDLDDTCETRTEDVSSDILDLSKNTDIEADPSSSEETTPSFMTEEVAYKDAGLKQNATSQEYTKLNNTNVNQGTDMQSRFKVVKIESKEPFRRGRWTCLDYLAPQNTSENKEKVVEKSADDDGSGSSSASSSVQFADHELDQASVAALTVTGADTVLVVDPTVYPANSQNQLPNGVDYATSQYTPVPHSSTIVQGGAGAPQSQPPEPPVSQSFDMGASLSTQQQVLGNQSMNVSQSNASQSQSINLANSIPQSSSSIPIAANQTHSTPVSSQPVPTAEFQNTSSVPSGQSINTGFDATQVVATQVVNASEVVSQAVPENTQTSQAASSSASQNQSILDYQSNIGAASSAANTSDITLQGSPGNADVVPGLGQTDPVFIPPPQHEEVRQIESAIPEPAPVEPAVEAEGAVGGPAKPAAVVTSSTLTNQSFLSPPLLEMVSATAQHVNPGSKEDGEGESGASTVAIDNKIEQAMDLVKSHLMFAVREEVEVLKEQIKELLEKNSQLEYEINILKANATPETLQKLAQVSQTQTQPPTSTS